MCVVVVQIEEAAEGGGVAFSEALLDEQFEPWGELMPAGLAKGYEMLREAKTAEGGAAHPDLPPPTQAIIVGLFRVLDVNLSGGGCSTDLTEAVCRHKQSGWVDVDKSATRRFRVARLLHAASRESPDADGGASPRSTDDDAAAEKLKSPRQRKPSIPKAPPDEKKKKRSVASRFRVARLMHSASVDDAAAVEKSRQRKPSTPKSPKSEKSEKKRKGSKG